MEDNIKIGKCSVFDNAPNLQEFLQLDNAEKNFLDEFTELYDIDNLTEQQIAAAVKFLSTKVTDPFLMVKLCEVDKLVATISMNSAMSAYWQMQWKMLGKYPTFIEAKKIGQTHLYQALIPQPFINCMNLVKGMVFLDLAENRKVFFEAQQKFTSLDCMSHPEVIELLEKACSFGSFAAFASYNIVNRTRINAARGKEIIDEFSRMLQICEKAANLHGTPGYILYALTYWDMACCHAKFDQREQAKEKVLQVFLHLAVADGLQSLSSESIHNAYYGKGIASIPIMQKFKVSTLQELYNYLKNYFNLTDEILAKIELAAAEKIETLKTHLQYVNISSNFHC